MVNDLNFSKKCTLMFFLVVGVWWGTGEGEVPAGTSVHVTRQPAESDEVIAELCSSTCSFDVRDEENTLTRAGGQAGARHLHQRGVTCQQAIQQGTTANMRHRSTS